MLQRMSVQKRLMTEYPEGQARFVPNTCAYQMKMQLFSTLDDENVFWVKFS